MTSEVDIANMALAHLGEDPVDSLEEASARGRACALWYPRERTRLLEIADWSWSRYRRPLTALATNPRPDEWRFAYQMPTDVERVLAVYSVATGGEQARWPYEIEGETLFSDVQSAMMRATRLIEDPARWSEAFRQALAWALAAKMAYRLTQSDRLTAWSMRQADEALDAALGLDADMEYVDETGGEPPALAARG